MGVGLISERPIAMMLSLMRDTPEEKCKYVPCWIARRVPMACAWYCGAVRMRNGAAHAATAKQRMPKASRARHPRVPRLRNNRRSRVGRINLKSTIRTYIVDTVRGPWL